MKRLRRLAARARSAAPLPVMALALLCGLPGAVAAAQEAQSSESVPPTVLITGSNRGIGLAFTEWYAEQGWNVVATCLRPDKHGLCAVVFDVTCYEGIHAVGRSLSRRGEHSLRDGT